MNHDVLYVGELAFYGIVGALSDGVGLGERQIAISGNLGIDVDAIAEGAGA